MFDISDPAARTMSSLSPVVVKWNTYIALRDMSNLARLLEFDSVRCQLSIELGTTHGRLIRWLINDPF
jgi:hypothetical protein